MIQILCYPTWPYERSSLMSALLAAFVTSDFHFQHLQDFSGQHQAPIQFVSSQNQQKQAIFATTP